MSEKSKLGNAILKWLDGNFSKWFAIVIAVAITLFFAYVYTKTYCNDCWPVAPIEQGRGE